MVFQWLVLIIDEFLRDIFLLILELIYNMFEYLEYLLTKKKEIQKNKIKSKIYFGNNSAN